MHSLVLIFFYAIVPVFLGLVLASVIAHTRVRGATFFRAVLFLPQTLATVVVAIAWTWIYAPSGPLNEALDAVGLDSISRGWLGDFTWALPALGLVGTWVMFGLAHRALPRRHPEDPALALRGRARRRRGPLPGVPRRHAAGPARRARRRAHDHHDLRAADVRPDLRDDAGRPRHVDDRPVRARLPERVRQRPGRARRLRRRRPDRPDLRRRLRDHEARRPGSRPSDRGAPGAGAELRAAGRVQPDRAVPDRQHRPAGAARPLRPGDRASRSPTRSTSARSATAWTEGQLRPRAAQLRSSSRPRSPSRRRSLSTLAGYAFGTMRFRGSDTDLLPAAGRADLPVRGDGHPALLRLQGLGPHRQPLGADPAADRAVGPVRHLLDAGLLPLDAAARSSRPRGSTARRAS